LAFVRQYPLHPYPLLAKALALTWMQSAIRGFDADSRIAELAIGDGTFSRQLFGTRGRITGLDLSPYSLSKAKVMPHVARAVVADAMEPPLADHYFDLL